MPYHHLNCKMRCLLYDFFLTSKMTRDLSDEVYMLSHLAVPQYDFHLK